MTAPRPGCWNKPRPVADAAIRVQEGWYNWFVNSPVTTSPVVVKIPFTMSTECGVRESYKLPECVGCEHARKAAP